METKLSEKCQICGSRDVFAFSFDFFKKEDFVWYCKKHIVRSDSQDHAIIDKTIPFKALCQIFKDSIEKIYFKDGKLVLIKRYPDAVGVTKDMMFYYSGYGFDSRFVLRNEVLRKIISLFGDGKFELFDPYPDISHSSAKITDDASKWQF